MAKMDSDVRLFQTYSGMCVPDGRRLCTSRVKFGQNHHREDTPYFKSTILPQIIGLKIGCR